MEKVTMEQIRDFVIVLAALLGFLILIWNAVKAFREMRKPADDLQAWRRDVDEKLNHDHERLADLEEGNKVVCRGILALLSHEINGNSTDKLKASQQEMTNYLIDR